MAGGAQGEPSLASAPAADHGLSCCIVWQQAVAQSSSARARSLPFHQHLRRVLAQETAQFFLNLAEASPGKWESACSLSCLHQSQGGRWEVKVSL